MDQNAVATMPRMGRMDARNGLTILLRAAGRLPEVRELAGRWAGVDGLVAKAQGRMTDAMSSLRAAITHDNDDSGNRLWCAELAGAAAVTRDLATARLWLDQAGRYRASGDRLVAAWVELDHAWVTAAGGNRTSALEIARRAAGLARDCQPSTMEAVALYDMARLGAAAAVRPRLVALAPLIEDGFGETLATAAGGLAIGDGTALDRAAIDFADRGHLLLAAETAAAAARAYDRIGQGVRSRVSAERAVALTGKCQGAGTPLLRLDGYDTILTQREREIATMAVSQSSRRIANLLGLSVHTVNNNLARVYAKLGVRNRRGLAAFFGEIYGVPCAGD